MAFSLRWSGLLLTSVALTVLGWGKVEGGEFSIAFVSRQFEQLSPIGARRTGVVERSLYGRLLVRAANGDLQTLVDVASPDAPDDTPSDVSDPDVSYDGTRIVFAGFSPADAAWRIYEVGTDGSGLRRVTTSSRQINLDRFGEAAAALRGYDDVDPCYLPDGRICFVSTRYPGIAPDNRLRTTNLYVVNADGSDLHRITSERFGGETPAVDPTTGKIVYSRWWRSPGRLTREGADAGEHADDGEDDAEDGEEPRFPGYTPPGRADEVNRDTQTPAPILDGIEEEDFPGLNHWFLASIRPDGNGLQMFSGTGLDRQATQAYRPAFLPSGDALGVFLPTTPFLGRPGNFGLRLVHRGSVAPDALGGPQTFSLDGTAPHFLYASAAPLPDGRILVTGTPSGVVVNYDVYVQSLERADPVKLFGSRHAELDAVPLVARSVPPVLADQNTHRMDDFVPRNLHEAFHHGGAFTFSSENIFNNPPVDQPLPNGLPIGKQLFIDFFLNPQGTSALGVDEPILIASQKIGANGRVEIELPAGVPLFELIRRPDGTVARGADGQIFHVGGHNFGVRGARASCVGCHAGHTLLPVSADPAQTNVAPSALVEANTSRARIDADGRLRVDVARNLVDRSTEPNSNWVAGPSFDEDARIDLQWSIPIAAREVVLHGVSPQPRTNITVHAVDLATYLDDEIVDTLEIAREIQPEGTTVALPTRRPFTRLEVTIDPQNVSGALEGALSLPALAEIEVIGQALEGSKPGVLFIRGDVNCDGRLNVTDGVGLLRALFVGSGPLCCEAAADSNADGGVNLADAMRVLLLVFRDSPPLLPPFPDCAPQASEDTLTCDQETCASRA